MSSDLVTDPVVELRVHGVSGTPPESMLDDPHPKQVAGDDVGRIFRRTLPVETGLRSSRRRVLEAFHWGRFTAGSATRALWLLLLPFAVVNVARYALLMPAERRRLDQLADLVLRLLGLMLTLTFVITAAYVALDVGARQCGISKVCADKNQWLSWFVDRSFGVRLVIASLLPALVLTLVWWFGRQTFQYDPPGPRRESSPGNGSFDDLMFWWGATSAPIQRAAHALAGCAVLGAMALGTLGDPAQWLQSHGPWEDRIYVSLFVLCAAVFLLALALVVANRQPRLPEEAPDVGAHDAVALPLWLRRSRRYAAVPLAVACVWWSAHQLGDSTTAGKRALSGLEIAANFSAMTTGLLLLVLLVVCVAMARTNDGRCLRRGATTAHDPAVPKAFRPYWFGLGAWVLAALAAMLASGFSTAVVFWTSKLLGRPVLEGSSEAKPGTLAIDLATSYWTGALLWGSIAALTGLLLLPLTAWLLHRRTALVGGFVAAAVTITAVAVKTYGGEDLLSDQAEWFGIAGLLVAGAVGICASPKEDGFPKRVSQDYEGDDKDGLRRSRPRVVRRWRTTFARYRYHHALGLIASLGGLMVILAGTVAAWRIADPGVREETPEQLRQLATGPFGTIGVGVVTAMAAGLVTLGIATWRKPGIRTATGILWDLVSFWPRRVHPLCPPPYGGRAVLGVAVRASQLVNDLKADAVVLSGHSQGSVVTFAACAVLHRQATDPDNDAASEGSTDLDRNRASNTLPRLRMVTYGSQLQFIYARLFPSYMGFSYLGTIYREALKGRWLHMYRWTDPLGGPVLSWPRADSSNNSAAYGPAVTHWTLMSCPDQNTCPGHKPQQVDLAAHDGFLHRYWSIGPDVRLRDPDVIMENARHPRSPLRGHSGHEADPGFDTVVDELATATQLYPSTCAEPE